MEEFKKGKSLMEGKGEIEWITTENGVHIPIKPGQTKAEAIKENFNHKRENKNMTFEDQVDAVLNESYKDFHVKILEQTPKIFQEIGIDNKPFLMTAKHVYLSINKEGKYTGKEYHYHNLGKELFLALPKLLERPALILQNRKSKNEILAIISWYDKNKDILIVPIKLNGRGNDNFHEIDAHITKSAYGKINFEKYINDNFTQDDILSVENKKIRSLQI